MANAFSVANQEKVAEPGGRRADESYKKGALQAQSRRHYALGTIVPKDEEIGEVVAVIRDLLK